MFIGSEIEILQDGSLAFGEDIFYPDPDVYYLEDSLDVMYQKPEQLDKHPLYCTYMGVYKKQDSLLFQEMHLRHDLTMVFPGLTANEFYKTPGHFLSLKPDSHETYVAIYEVLWGEGLFLLQKNNRSGEAEEARVISAKKGDKVFIPPSYGLVLINIGQDKLVTSGLVNVKADFIYEPFIQKQGAAYYYIVNENQKPDFIKNPRYAQTVGLELLGAPSVSLPFDELKEKNLYQTFVDNPKLFNAFK
ncbi:MAG: glucose-6-phosphate isomerase family protein [Bacillota bacterium]